MVHVYLMQRPGRCIECQWKDPVTGLLKTKTTGTKKRRDAERIAGALEADLNAGRADETVNALWGTVRERYESEVLSSRAVKTLHKWQATANAMAEIINPKYIAALNASQVSRFQTGLRNKGLAEATIKGHLSALRACLNWAHRMGMLAKVPHIAMPKRTGRMKSRPITSEEFERMLASIHKVAKPHLADEWRWLLKGLWWSGLRLDEALRLSWDNGPIAVNMAGDRPRLKFEANADKSTKPRLLPIAPEFADLLLAIPERKRHGRVFRPVVPGQLGDMRLDTCSKFITRIGRKAGVCVAEHPPRGESTEPRKSWAGAHCFRRAFGTRWAKRLLPQQLQELMRHESITTTMTFYVERDIADVEKSMMQEPPNSSPNSNPVLPHKATEFH